MEYFNIFDHLTIVESVEKLRYDLDEVKSL